MPESTSRPHARGCAAESARSAPRARLTGESSTGPESSAALLALWNDVEPALDAAYNDWHAREHVPERLTVPGIQWALRYARLGVGVEPTMPRYLTLYGLRDAKVLECAAYRRLLEHPTPASRAMRPALRHLARWVCALDVQDGIERFERIAMRTVGRHAAWPARPPAGALVVATRIPEASELPWLAGRQSRPIKGERLEGLAHDPTQPIGPDWSQAPVYARLPVGG